MDLGYVLLLLFGYVTSVASLTRLVNYDRVLDPLRLWIARRASAAHQAAAEHEIDGRPNLAHEQTRRFQRWSTALDFVGCPWCVSPYFAAALAPAVIEATGWGYWTFPFLVLSTRYLVGLADRWVADSVQIVDDEQAA